ncbi:MAG: threonine synthase [Vicinamibacterales bacterium]
MSDKYGLTCAWCGRPHDPDTETRCFVCDGPLRVDVDLRPLLGRGAANLRRPEYAGVWAWLDLLPIVDRDAIVSLGEGRTPLLAAPRLGAALGVDSLWLKDETRNPTGSFKDRMLTVGVSRAVERGRSVVAVQSSGNVGAAAAAYAARAGLEAKIFVPRTAPPEKILQAQMYGADVYRIDHDSPVDIFELLQWACAEFGWTLVSTAAIYNPFTLEGAKTIAYEIAEATAFDVPDWVVVPVGGGGNIGSVWRGFLDLRALGLVTRLPRMVGVQAAGCAPFVDAIHLGRRAQDALTHKWPDMRTIAGAIADDVVFDAHVALPAVRDSGGTAVAVPDEDTLAMEALVARTEGLFVEPAAATTLAATKRLAASGVIRPGDEVVCLMTGTGLKDPGAASRLVTPVVTMPLDRAAVAAHVRAPGRL